MPNHFWPLARVDIFSLLVQAAAPIRRHNTKGYGQVWLYVVGIHAMRYQDYILLSVIIFISSCITEWVLHGRRIERQMLQQAIEGNRCADVPDALAEGGSTLFPHQIRSTHEEPTRYAVEPG
jgi:hypothetical protein